MNGKAKECKGECIHCGSEDIEYGSIIPAESGIYYPIVCNNCEGSSKEYYTLTYDETIGRS